MSTVTISRWGNGLAVRIPKAVLEEGGLKEGDAMSMEMHSGILTLKKVRKVKKYSIDEVLSSCHTTAETPEMDWGESQGREVW